MEPKNYVGDNFSRITEIYRVTQYNIACCYAAMGSVSETFVLPQLCKTRCPLRDCNKPATEPCHNRGRNWEVIDGCAFAAIDAGHWQLWAAILTAAHRQQYR